MAMVLAWPMSAFKLSQVLTTWRNACDREDYDDEVDKHCPKQLLTNSGVPGPVELRQLPYSFVLCTTFKLLSAAPQALRLQSVVWLPELTHPPSPLCKQLARWLTYQKFLLVT
jgi:hypothetical protein